MYGCLDDQVAHYLCYHINSQIIIDGNLEKKPWINAPKANLVNLVTGQSASLSTKIAALWNTDYFYVAFWIKEPNVQATLDKRDSQIYCENDVELFIAGNDCYYEFQINALGTIYEVFYIWQDAYTKESRFNCAEFDLFERNIDVIGGFQDTLRYKKHPRGKRWAFMDWDFPGLKTAIQVQGTINDSSDCDNGWTVELAFPWNGFTSLYGRTAQPKINDILRINFSRFQSLSTEDYSQEKHPGWSLNAHGVYDSHIPSCFSFVHLEATLNISK
ncbi:MAG: carbohydrate-binding family 9-like protein [Candidatus Heimdallarchaeota archaeon]|nr:carbohydrate-binding family 9-like protein [Candidatus Heimdallarchaeota archaeon]